MNIKQVPINIGNYSQLSTKKVGFVMHWMDSEIEAAESWFKNPAAHVSAHYGIGSNGEIHQWVPDDKVAWHAGNSQANSKYIGIEHAGGFKLADGTLKKPTPECHQASIELVTSLCRKMGINKLERKVNIFKHNEIVATNCCGTLDIDYITNEVNKRLVPNIPSIPLPTPNPNVTIDTNISIEGNFVASREQMVSYLNKVNPNPKINCTVQELVDIFLEEGKLENIRGDIAFAQSLHETGNFNFGGQVLPVQNNFAGIGATNNSATGKGAWFDLPRTGVRAQIQHLKAYANNLPLNSELVDPRFNLVQPRGEAPRWIDLNGKWAVPGTTYGQMILQIYSNIINMPNPTPTPPQIENFALDQRQIDEFMRIFNEKPEDRKIKDLPYTDEQIGYLRGIILANNDVAQVVRIILEDMKRMRAEIADLKKL